MVAKKDDMVKQVTYIFKFISCSRAYFEVTVESGNILKDLLNTNYVKPELLSFIMRQENHKVSRRPYISLIDVRVQFGTIFPDKYDWMCDAAMGGGALNLVGSHVIDLVKTLLPRSMWRVNMAEAESEKFKFQPIEGNFDMQAKVVNILEKLNMANTRARSMDLDDFMQEPSACKHKFLVFAFLSCAAELPQPKERAETASQVAPEQGLGFFKKKKKRKNNSNTREKGREV
uniref:Gfo/Idh/MocA-like oxidoreductase C-terminal domain-containing protein n=1 Tax=Glossina pallidipes TaxID=7398 RepID=A0A1B0A5Q1_GLOPL